MRLVPFVALMFFINYLDRTAISFAGPNGMNEDLGLSAAQFGFASGIFFAGYILLEIPSNMALYKFGARRWLARIMVSWGIVSLLFTFVQNIPSLYALRVLLGIAEAGFFPGAILFLSLWVPARYRSKILALFYLAQPLTTVIGAPLAGLLIKQHGVFGLEGWRFMFLCVSIPAILVGVIAWFYLADSPRQAKWLTPDGGRMAEPRDRERSEGRRPATVAAAASWPRCAAAGYGSWRSSTSDSSTGCTRSRSSCRPSSPGSRSSSAPSSMSSRRGSSPRSRTCRPPWCCICGHATPPSAACKTWHIAVPAFVGGLSVPVALFMGSPAATIAVITVTACAIFAALPNFWTVPAKFLTGGAAAVGIALINTFGNVGRLRRGIRDRLPQGSHRVLRRAHVRRRRTDGAVRRVDGVLTAAGRGRVEPTGPEAESDPGTEIAASGPVR